MIGIRYQPTLSVLCFLACSKNPIQTQNMVGDINPPEVKRAEILFQIVVYERQ